MRRDRSGGILYQLDNDCTQWLSTRQFEALTSGQIPRDTPRPSYTEPRPTDFRLFPPDDPPIPRTTEANADHVTGSFGDEVSLRYEHGLQNAGEQGRHDPARTTRTNTYIDGQGRQIYPATSATRGTYTVISGGQHVSYQPQLTPLAQAFAQLEIGDFNGLNQFVLKNRGILARPEIDNLLSEAAYAQRAGKEGLAQKYVHHAVLLQKCSKCRPEALEPLFQRLATRGEATKDLFTDVKKVHNSIKSQYAVPEPQRPERVAQGKATAAPEQGRVGNPEPRIIQTREQRDVTLYQSIDRVNSQLAQSQLRQAGDKDGRRVYVDSHGREIRPAGGRHEFQRVRHDSQITLPTGEMSEITLDDLSANLRPEQVIDSPMGSPGVGNQRRQRYGIEGTAGNKEALDAGYMKRRNPKEFFTLGKVFALLWHQSISGERPKFELSEEISVTRGRFQQEIHSSIRRMVVVKENNGHCWCLMIYTYGEQGVLKSGLSPNDRKAHAVIHMTGARPTDLQDEHLMNKEPIAVDPASPDQKLHRMSRLDFRRVHTVEHNVKVKNIGRVSKRSMPYLVGYFRDVVNGQEHEVRPAISRQEIEMQTLKADMERLEQDRERERENRNLRWKEKLINETNTARENAGAIRKPKAAMDSLKQERAREKENLLNKDLRMKQKLIDEARIAKKKPESDVQDLKKEVEGVQQAEQTEGAIEEDLKSKEQLLKAAETSKKRAEKEKAEVEDEMRRLEEEMEKLQQPKYERISSVKNLGLRAQRHQQTSVTPAYGPLSGLQPSPAPLWLQTEDRPERNFSDTPNPDLDDEQMRDVQVSPYLLELKHWKLLVEYLDLEFDRHSPVDDIVILVSDETNAWCTTCKEYVEWKWGIFGVGVLDFLNFLLAQKNSFHDPSSLSALGKDHETQFEGQTTLLRLYSLSVNGAGHKSGESHNTASICVVGPKEAAQTSADILAWILSALTIPPEDDQFATEEDCVVLQLRSQPIYSISSLSRKPRPLSDSTCWHALFPRKVVALGSIPLRPPGMKGLEINYSLLVQLSGVDLPVLEKGGLYLDGYNSALYPISYSDNKQCLQWHLSCRPVHTLAAGDDGVYSTDTCPILYHGEWYKTRNLTDLEAPKRHFVGWCASAIVTLGTDIQDYTTANWSRAKSKADSIIESSTNLNLNLSFHGIGTTAGKTYKRGRNERNAYENHEHNFLTSLVHAKQSQMLLYCPSTLQGWLVPKASVLLHLILMWMVYMKKGDSSLELPLYYAAKSYDGGENAYQVLKYHGTDPLPFGDGDKPYRLMNVVRMFLFAMSKLQRLSAPEGHAILGWELYDLVDPPEFFEMKEAKFRRRDLTILGGWNKMLPKISMVLFYEGLEDPIVAQDYQSCSGWATMPPKRNLLGVTLVSLKHFTRRFQSGYLQGSGQLTDKCYWHCPSNLFEECECGERCTCERVQMIYLHNRGKPPSVDMLSVGTEGAVIFESGSISWHSIRKSRNAQ